VSCQKSWKKRESSCTCGHR